MSNPPIVPVLEALGFDGLLDDGGWRPVRCALHGDRRPSASYNPDLGVFVCHGCGIKGDAYSVIMAAEGIGFVEAKQRVSAITGVDGSGVSQRPAERSRLPLWARQRLSQQQKARPGGNRLVSPGHGRRVS